MKTVSRKSSECVEQCEAERRRAEREAFRKDPVGFYFERIHKEFGEEVLIATKIALNLCLKDTGEGNVGLGAKDIVRIYGSEKEALVSVFYWHLKEVEAGKRGASGKKLEIPKRGSTLITQISPRESRIDFVSPRVSPRVSAGENGYDGYRNDEEAEETGYAKASIADVSVSVSQAGRDDGDEREEGNEAEVVEEDGYAKASIATTRAEYVGQELPLSADSLRKALEPIASSFNVKKETIQRYILDTIRHQAMQVKFIGKDKVCRHLSKEQAEKHIKNFCCANALMFVTEAVDKKFHLLSEEQKNKISLMSNCEQVVLSICAMNTNLLSLAEMSHECRLEVLREMTSKADSVMRASCTVAEPKRRRRAKVPPVQEPVQALEAPAHEQEQEQEQEPVQAQQPEVLEALEPVQALEAPAHEQEQEPVQARQPDQVPVQMPELPAQPQPQPQPEPEPAPMPKPTPEPAPARLAEQLDLFAAEVADAAIARARKRAKRTTAPAPAQGWVQEQLALDLCSSELADAAIAQAKASAELVRVIARARDRVTERIADAELRCKADQTRAPPGRRRKRKGVAMAAH